MSEMTISRIGGRKFSLVVVVYITTIILLLMDKLTKTDYLGIVMLMLTSYVLSSLIQTLIINKLGSSSNNVPSDVLSAYGGRMFGLVTVIFIVTSLLLGFSVVNSEVYMDVSKWLIGIYLSGNITEKIFSSINLAIKVEKVDKPTD